MVKPRLWHWLWQVSWVMWLLVNEWPVRARWPPSEKQPVAVQVPEVLFEEGAEDPEVGAAGMLAVVEATRTWDTLLAATTEADDFEAEAEADEVGTETTDDDTTDAAAEDEETTGAAEEDETTGAAELEARTADDDATDAAAELEATGVEDTGALLGVTDAAPALRSSRR